MGGRKKRFRPLSPKISPLEPPTVLEVGGCNSRRFKAIAKPKHVLESLTRVEC